MIDSDFTKLLRTNFTKELITKDKKECYYLKEISIVPGLFIFRVSSSKYTQWQYFEK